MSMLGNVRGRIPKRTKKLSENSRSRPLCSENNIGARVSIWSEGVSPSKNAPSVGLSTAAQRGPPGVCYAPKACPRADGARRSRQLLKMKRQSRPYIFVGNDWIDTKYSPATAKLNQMSVRRLLTLLIDCIGRDRCINH